MARLAALWTRARDGFADEVAAGAITPDGLRRLVDNFLPRAEDELFAARIALEAARAGADTSSATRASEACTGHVGAALREAQTLRDAGRFSEAQALLERTLLLLPEDHGARWFLFHPLADGAKLQGEWDRALAFVEEGLAGLAGDARFTAWCVDLLLVRAGTYVDMGLPDLALAPLRVVENELASEGTPIDLATRLAALHLWARYWLATDRVERLVERLGEELDSLGPAFDLDPLERVQCTKLRIQLALGQLELSALHPELTDEAEQNFRSAWEQSEDSVDRFNCASRLTWIGLLREDPLATENWLARAATLASESELTAYQRGFLAALEARAAVARKAGEDELDAVQQRLSVALERMMHAWRTTQTRPGGLAFLRYSGRRFTVGTLLELEQRQGTEEGLLQSLRTLYEVRRASTLVRRLGEDVGSFDAAREALLGEGHGALVYFVGRDRSHVFALDREGIVHEAIPGEWPLRTLARDFETVLLQDPADMDEEARARRLRVLEERGKELAQALLPAAVAARVGSWRALTIVGGDLLGEPSFEALPFDGAPLGLALPLAYLTSLPEGMALHERGMDEPHGKPSVCLVAAVPIPPDLELPPLPLSRERASGLVEPFRGRAHVLLGEQATGRALGHASRETGLLALLTHGLRDPSRERPSQLLLADEAGDHALSCEEVEALGSPACVVLGACGSGRGPAREGAGPVAHLGGAFLLAGARSVVLSDATLAYYPTLALVETLLGSLADGEPPARALWLARRALVEQGWRDPHDHALLRAIGLGHEPLFGPR